MQKHQITEGEHYAVTHDEATRWTGNEHRAEVIEASIDGGKRRYYSSTPQTLHRVAILDNDGAPRLDRDGTPTVWTVTSKQVRRTWAAKVQASVEADRAWKASEAEEAKRQADQDAVQRGLDAWRAIGDHGTVTLSGRELQAIVKLATLATTTRRLSPELAANTRSALGDAIEDLDHTVDALLAHLS